MVKEKFKMDGLGFYVNGMETFVQIVPSEKAVCCFMILLDIDFLCQFCFNYGIYYGIYGGIAMVYLTIYIDFSIENKEGKSASRGWGHQAGK